MICCPLDSLGSTSHGATTKTTGEQHIMILFAGCPGADQQGRQRTDCNEGDADALGTWEDLKLSMNSL